MNGKELHEKFLFLKGVDPLFKLEYHAGTGELVFSYNNVVLFEGSRNAMAPVIESYRVYLTVRARITGGYDE